MVNPFRKKKVVIKVKPWPRSKKCDEIARDQKLNEFAYVIDECGIDYLIPYLYEWNLYNTDDLITVRQVDRRLDWIIMNQLNELYTTHDLEIDNINLDRHDLIVQLPSKLDIMKYRIGKTNGEDNRE